MIDKDRLLRTFLDLVKIDSPSGEEEAIAQELTLRLAALGANVQRDAFGNLIAKLDGEGEALLLGAHMDTVEPGRSIQPVIDGDVVRTDGSTVLGGDPKAGVAAILEALASIQEDGAKHPPVEIVLTRHEESALGGSHNLDYSLVTARRGVEFDGEGPVSNITIAAPARLSVQATFIGRGAHAGVEPDKGVSAIQMAARFVAGYPQGRLDDESTGNIGLISGGTAVNAVPSTATIAAEVRSRDPVRLEALKAEIAALATRVGQEFPGGRVQLEVRQEFGGYKLNQSDPAVAWASAALRKIGLSPALIDSGGATDANNYAVHGLQVVVVGLGGEDFHTVRESLSIANLVDAARFCAALLTA